MLILCTNNCEQLFKKANRLLITLEYLLLHPLWYRIKYKPDPLDHSLISSDCVVTGSPHVVNFPPTKTIVNKKGYTMNFGEKLKALRIAKRLTLRDCAAILAIDPSNWSKFERSVTPAPKDITVLESWAEYFELTGADKAAFFDLAALSRQELPADIADDARVMQALPAFFRAVRGKELEGEKLQEFIEDLRKIHSPQPDHQG